MIVALPLFAAAAVASILAVSSGINVFQTVQCAAKKESSSSTNFDSAMFVRNNENLVAGIQTLSRENILDVFRSQCIEPEGFECLEGDWNAVLLDNNGPIMTRVSALLTHKFFGKGRRWVGKSFDGNSKSGINLFDAGSRDITGQTVGVHGFDCTVTDSRLLSGENSLLLDYTPSQSKFSLWRTMKDELRVLRCDDQEFDIMIGLGWMGWSGGVWNSSPFCLYREKSKTNRA